jgi:hypothetical protein
MPGKSYRRNGTNSQYRAIKHTKEKEWRVWDLNTLLSLIWLDEKTKNILTG